MRERPEPREMTDEERTAMECMRKAMESCGIQMPTPPQRPDNSDEQRREPPMGRQKPQRPERPVNQ